MCSSGTAVPGRGLERACPYQREARASWLGCNSLGGNVYERLLGFTKFTQESFSNTEIGQPLRNPTRGVQEDLGRVKTYNLLAAQAAREHQQHAHLQQEASVTEVGKLQVVGFPNLGFESLLLQVGMVLRPLYACAARCTQRNRSRTRRGMPNSSERVP